MNEYDVIAKRVVEERERRGWNQRELADRLQRNNNFVWRLENAKLTTPPDPAALRDIERELGISRRWVLETLDYLDPVEMEPGIVEVIRDGDIRLPLLRAMDAMTPAGRARFVEIMTPVAEAFTASPERKESKTGA